MSITLAAIAAPVLLRIAARHSNSGFVIGGAVFLLALVWAVNFFIILPWLNPAFVTLMPYSVSLASKLLFGVTLGVVLCSLPRRKAGVMMAVTASNHSD